jgi:hypothetical protein
LSITMPLLYTNEISVSELISLTNLERAKVEVGPLLPNSLLNQAAQAKANDMLALGYFSHTSVTDKAPWVFINDTGYDYALAGENLARDYTSSADVVNAWMTSPLHKANLLNSDYSDIGLAITTGNYPDGKPTVIVVQLLAKPSTNVLTENPRFTSSDLLSNTKTSIWPAILMILALTLILIGYFLIKRKKSKKKFLPPSLWQH